VTGRRRRHATENEPKARIVKQARRPTVAAVLDRVLDKRIVIDYQSRILVSGIDLGLAIDARCVVASFETYLQYAEPLSRTGLLWGAEARRGNIASS